MADAYATLANGGSHVAPTAITKVVFADGRVLNLGDPPHKRVFSDGEAYTATQVLKTVIQSGTGTAASYGCPAAGKTGTTSNYTDAWFVGYTPQLSTAVWVGYPHSTQSMNDVNGLGPGFGGTLAAPIWHDYMVRAHGGYCGEFPPPSDPFNGTPFFGHYARTGGASGHGSGSGSGASGTGYYAPPVYVPPPAPPSGGGATNNTGGATGSGGGNPKKTGSGNGHGNGHGGSGGNNH
jgi:penicillin-binding protein 1A